MSNTALSWHKMLRLSEVLDKATVSDLHLNFESEKIWVKPEGPRELWPVFHKLRFLNLADISEECDLAWTLFILEGAPSLKELCLQVKSLYLISKYVSLHLYLKAAICFLSCQTSCAALKCFSYCLSLFLLTL
jgi:hypothetical protein